MGILFALLALSPARASDPLFDRMAGSWLGEGLTRYALSGRKLQVEIATTSEITEGGLVSRNEVRELPVEPPGAERRYARAYRIVADGAGYRLEGAPGAPAARGALVGEEFSTEQELAGGYVVRTATEFAGDSAVFLETNWHEGTRLSETEIRFRRR